jgi:hypothetical protein
MWRQIFHDILDFLQRQWYHRLADMIGRVETGNMAIMVMREP